MQNSLCTSSDVFEMTFSQDNIARESRIDKMKKFLSSPLTRKKGSGSQSKTFGVPLDALIQRAPSEIPVPFIVSRICQYIENTGMMHEGLFRISGNARLIEKLKSCFDQSGDAPLETEGDISSAAALLKLFFRELPDTIIPLSMHQQFLHSVKGTSKEEGVKALTSLVEKLPFANYNVLKYLSNFLLKVSQYEEQNRMSASSLGIVFGPNLFKVTEDYIGLKEQSLTNQIVTYFITDYYTIFQNEPKWYTSSSKMSVSLDSHLKHNNISISDNECMVSSWPRLSSFPAMISPLSFRPLSVSIPTMEEFPAKSSGNNFTYEENHILEINSDGNEDQSMPCDQEANKGETEFNESSKQNRKKHKEQVVDLENIDTEKLFPHVHHVPSERNGNIHGSLKKSNRLSSTSDSFQMAKERTDMAHDMNGGTNQSSKENFNAVSEESTARSSVNENGQSIVTLAEVHDSGSHDDYPRAEKTYSYNHRHYRHGRGLRSHYLKKSETKGERTHKLKREPHVEPKSNLHEHQPPKLTSNVESNSFESESSMELADSSSGNTNEDQNYPWPILQRVQEDEAASVSPIPHFLKINSSSEAPLSPSAFKSYLSHRNPHLDPNLPPSPPVEQEDLFIGDGANKIMIKTVNKRIQGLKKKMKQVEDNLNTSHRLSYAEKCVNPQFKSLATELNQANLELKQLKYDPPIVEPLASQDWTFRGSNDSLEAMNKKTNACIGMSSGLVLKDNPPGTIEESLEEALKFLADNRKSGHRPEALEDMSREQLTEEKYTIQKMLLQFESLHGRPNSKNHRDLVRPLYDRYRNAKRILTRSSSFTSILKAKDSVELQPILEHETMDFGTSPTRVPDGSLVPESSDNNTENNGIDDDDDAHANLHELSLAELFDLQQKARTEKRRLRKILKEFEIKFQKDNGRKVQRDDKYHTDIKSTYGMYKNVKARLRLLQALAAKQRK